MQQANQRRPSAYAELLQLGTAQHTSSGKRSATQPVEVIELVRRVQRGEHPRIYDLGSDETTR